MVRSTSRDQCIVVVAAFVAMLAPGALYSYSLLAAALARANPSHVASTVPFAVANFALGFGAVCGGRWMRRMSPRTGAATGAVLWGLGNVLAALGGGDTTSLALGYGAVGGFGCGLVYISVLTAIDASFSARRGLAFGIAVCGFGCGAPLFSRAIGGSLDGAGLALAHGIRAAFFGGGIAFAMIGIVAATFLRAPVDAKPNDRPAASVAPARGWTIALLWTMLFVNALAGLVVIGNALPLVGDLLHASPAASSRIFATLSVANALGRLVGGALYDRFGGAVAFRTLFGLQVAAFLVLSYATTPAAIVVALATILLCYGGGFGAMPGLCRSTVGERFSATYGVLLTAWGAAGILGLWLSTSLRAFTASFAEAVTPIALLLAVALLLPSMLEVSARPDLLTDEH